LDEFDMKATSVPRTVAMTTTVTNPKARPSRDRSICKMERRSARERDAGGPVTSSSEGGLGNAELGARRSSPPSSAKKTKDRSTVAFPPAPGPAPASPVPAEARSSTGSGPTGATGDAADAVAGGAEAGGREAGGAGSSPGGGSSFRRLTIS
jgi:hypothetical protein